MRSSGRPLPRLVRHLLTRLALAAVVAAGLWMVLWTWAGVAGWLAGLIGVGAGLAAYVGALAELSKAVVGLGDVASSLLGSDPVPASRPLLRVEEIEALAATLREAGHHFRSAEKALLREQSLLNVVLEALPGGVLLVDADNRVAYANSACSQMLGVLEDPSGRLALRDLRVLVRRVRQGGGTHEETLTRGYPQRTMGVRAFTVDEEGRVMVVVLDLTESLRIETIRRDFVADASHELKTPVASILASADALQMALERGGESSGMFAEQISEAALRLSRLIADLLDLSRLETREPTRDYFDLEEVVLTEVKPFVEAAGEKGIQFEVETVSAMVRGSPAELGLAIRNLCDNALRYTEGGGRIGVAMEVADGEAALSVSDTGMGIPGRDLGRIFERFYRVDVARSRRTGGTGLGLAIVRHVMERHHGRVTVKSLLGEGSTFTLVLPTAEAAPASL